MRTIILRSLLGLCIAIAASGILYIAFSFGIWNWNPGHWDSDARGILAIISCVLLIGIPIGFGTSKV